MIKKFFVVCIILVILFICEFTIILNYTNEVLAANEEENLPKFYGTTRINIKVGDNLNLQDSIYRIFAKDYLGRDISKKIEIESNNVNSNKVGTYEIKYSVEDYDGNYNSIYVPVQVTNTQKSVQKTLYTLPNTLNINNSGTKRGDYADRQNLGIYMPKGSNIKVRVLEGKNVEGEYITNSRLNDFRINNDWTTLTAEEDCVPLIQTKSVGKKYNTRYNTSKNLKYATTNKFREEETIYMATVVERNTTKKEILKEIRLPVQECTSFKIYINKDGELNFKEEDLIYKRNDNNEKGYAYIDVSDKNIELTNSKYSIAIEYTGTAIPIGDVQMYKLDSSTGKWDQKGSRMFPNISMIVESGEDNTVLEVDLSDLESDKESIQSLNYYHYCDGINAQNKFLNTSDTYSIIESERMTMMVPLADMKKIIINNSDEWKDFYNKVKNAEAMYSKEEEIYDYFFKSIDDLLLYYEDIISTYDEYIGLELETNNKNNKNVLSKFFIRTNKNGAGGAYYTSTEIANSSETLGGFLYKSWGPLHEIGHGYEASWYGRYSGEKDTKIGNINLTEVANNIFAYQYEKKILKNKDYSWLLTKSYGSNAKVFTSEELDSKLNSLVQSDIGEYFDDIFSKAENDEIDILHLKLYYILDILDLLESDDMATVTCLYKNYREEMNSSNPDCYTTADRLVVAVYETSNRDIINKLEAYNIVVSDNLKKEIRQLENIDILGDINIDGEINTQDLLILKKYLVGCRNLYGQAKVNADINKDGEVNAKDYSKIKRYFLEYEEI